MDHQHRTLVLLAEGQSLEEATASGKRAPFGLDLDNDVLLSFEQLQPLSKLAALLEPWEKRKGGKKRAEISEKKERVGLMYISQFITTFITSKVLLQNDCLLVATFKMIYARLVFAALNIA